MNCAVVPFDSISKLTDTCWLFGDDSLDKFEIRSPHKQGNVVEVLEVDNGKYVLLNRFTCLSKRSALKPFTRCLSVLFCLLERDDADCFYSRISRFDRRVLRLSSRSVISDKFEPVIGVDDSEPVFVDERRGSLGDDPFGGDAGAELRDQRPEITAGFDDRRGAEKRG